MAGEAHRGAKRGNGPNITQLSKMQKKKNGVNASNRSNNTSTKSRRSTSTKRVAGVGLDANALAYARLVADPCNAPVVRPIYAGGESGYTFRAESFFTIGTNAGETAGIVHWTPGYVNSDATELVVGQAASASANITASANTSGPGRAFLVANATAVRCIAACIRITYPGAESARAGRIHYGNSNGGMIDALQVVTADGVAQALQNYTRTPPEALELVWRPGVADQEFNDPSAVASPQLRDRKSALTLAFAGLPATVGLTVHMTAVYEWLPRTALGVANDTAGKVVSRNTLDHVLDFLAQSGFRYAKGLGLSMATGAMQAMATTYGLMGARPVRRSLAY